MQNKIITFFPVDTIKLCGVLPQNEIMRINGVLQDTLSAIHCATSELTYKEYLSINSLFLLMSKEIVANAIKSMSISDEIYLSGKLAASYAEKNIKSLSSEIALNTLFIESIEKTFYFSTLFDITNNAKFSLEKTFLQLQQEFSFLLSQKCSAGKSANFNLFLTLDNIVSNFNTDKCINQIAVLTVVDNTIGLVAEKYSGAITSKNQLETSAKFALTRYRKMIDVDLLTLEEIDQWDMDTFDVLQS